MQPPASRAAGQPHGQEQQQQQQHAALPSGGGHRSESLVLRFIYLCVYQCLVLFTAVSTAVSAALRSLSLLLHREHVADTHKVHHVMPPHVAISCPSLATDARPALAAFILFLYARGVSHVSLFDPVSPIHASPLLAELSQQHLRSHTSSTTSTSSSDSSNSTEARPDDDDESDNSSNGSGDNDDHKLRVSVKHIGTQHTYKSTVLLPLPTSSSFSSMYINKTLQHSSSNLPSANPPTTNTDDARQRHTKSDIDINDTLLWNGVLQPPKPVDTLLLDQPQPLLQPDHDHDGRHTLHLTLVNPETSRAAIVRAAKHLIAAGAAPSVDQIIKFLDCDPMHANLPSEPDVLVVFPNPNAPPVPVLHDFPMWQLRLTQIVFAQARPQFVSYRSLVQMLSSAAKVPKRFGR